MTKLKLQENWQHNPAIAKNYNHFISSNDSVYKSVCKVQIFFLIFFQFLFWKLNWNQITSFYKYFFQENLVKIHMLMEKKTLFSFRFASECKRILKKQNYY